MGKNMKFILKMSMVGIVVFLIYLAIPKINMSESDVQLELERYESYTVSEILKDYLTDNSDVYIENNFGFKKIDKDDVFQLENDIVIKLVYKKNFYTSESISFHITAKDTIAPKISVVSPVTLYGGEKLENVIDITVHDYRYGSYDFELKNPIINFVSIIPGMYDYEVIVKDLAGNVASETIQIEVIPYEITQPELDSIDVWVNKARRLPSDYVPDLVPIPSEYTIPAGNRTFELKKAAADAFVEMADALFEETGLKIYASNAYRDYELQEYLFTTYAQRDGEEKANRYSARPGHSEHQTGLTLDVRTLELDYKDFGETKQYQWVLENAHQYGYIIRYTEIKESITGYQSEPWHLRYVGKEIASYLVEHDLSFDEYKLANLN